MHQHTIWPCAVTMAKYVLRPVYRDLCSSWWGNTLQDNAQLNYVCIKTNDASRYCNLDLDLKGHGGCTCYWSQIDHSFKIGVDCSSDWDQSKFLGNNRSHKLASLVSLATAVSWLVLATLCQLMNWAITHKPVFTVVNMFYVLRQ